MTSKKERNVLISQVWPSCCIKASGFGQVIRTTFETRLLDTALHTEQQQSLLTSFTKYGRN